MAAWGCFVCRAGAVLLCWRLAHTPFHSSESLPSLRPPVPPPLSNLPKLPPPPVHARLAMAEAADGSVHGQQLPSLALTMASKFSLVLNASIAQAFNGSRAAALRYYRRSLQYNETAAPPAGPPPTEAPDSGGSGGLSTGAVIVVAVVVPVATVALVLGVLGVLWAARVRGRHRTLTGGVKPPGPGPETTLVVTDIQVRCDAVRCGGMRVAPGWQPCSSLCVLPPCRPQGRGSDTRFVPPALRSLLCAACG